MKDLIKKEPRGVSVNKLIIITTFIVFVIGCNTTKIISDKYVSKEYKIKRFASKSGFSSIVVHSYYDDKYKNNRVYSFISVNDVYLHCKYIKDSLYPIKISTIPTKKYKIKVFSIGFLPLEVEDVYIEKGDSIVINAYLKEDTRPISCFAKSQ